ncbi:MAG: RHS repeat-associated core domain-containing protein, partial [Bacteroidota bacterium]
HANTSGYYRVGFDYSLAYLDDYYDFYVPGYEPPVFVEYELDYSDWTINYYDDDGLLRQAIQPKGIRCDFVDISQMGTSPFFKTVDVYDPGTATYFVGPKTVKNIFTPDLQTGLAQEVEMSIKTMVKPGIIVDHWYPKNDVITYAPITDPVEVQVIKNPFATSTNPSADIVLSPISFNDFELTYQPVPASVINAGDESLVPPPTPSQESNFNLNTAPATCNNGELDYGEEGIDCGGPCPACEDCEEEPDFLVSYEFEIKFQGAVDGTNQIINLGDGYIYRTFGLDCNGQLVDITDPDEEAIELDHFYSHEVIENWDFRLVRTRLKRTRVKTNPNSNWVNFDETKDLHRFIRYVYLRVDGVKDIYFNDPIPHDMKETVVYDELYRIVAMEDPDRGLSEFIHDDEDKLRFSQDARQAALGHFSYISYDARGRVVETGEYQGTSYYFPSTLRPPSPPGGALSVDLIKNQLDGLPSADRVDETYLTYDEIGPNFPGTVGPDYESTFVEGRVAMSKNDEHTTWYKYNHKGQLVAAVQEYPDLGLKTMDYTYDFYGRLTESTYQANDATETFTHLYSYDNNGDLRTIETKEGTALPKLHAAYEFYELGELKRTELGEKLQGIDYTYTIDGALKAINHPTLGAYDPGNDGFIGDHPDFAKDVFAMALDYHTLDYVRKGTFFNYGRDESATDAKDGRIKSIRWNTRNNIQAPTNLQHMFSYEYDWKQQLNSATYGYYFPFSIVNNNKGKGGYDAPAHGNFTANANAAFEVDNITYDANGNILSLSRKNDSGEDLDDMTYIYEHPDYLANNGAYTNATNKLRYVVDAAGFLDQGDVQNQQVDNYIYNANGEIEKDLEKDISLVYNSFGKLDEIRNYAGNRLVMSFLYDEAGNRINKTTYDATGAPEKSTTYVREPGGIVLATYEKDYAASNPSLDLSEYMLDGGQLGIFYPGGNQYVYHLTDHLGNVRATINRDKDASGEAEILSYADYYPYGMVMPGHEQASSPRYRLGYQGKELDAKVGLYAFQLRMYDPRLGKWLSPDPYDQHWSPYLAMSNNPVSFIDPDGGYDISYEIQVRMNRYIEDGRYDLAGIYLERKMQESDGRNAMVNALAINWNNYMSSVEEYARSMSEYGRNQYGEYGQWASILQSETFIQFRIGAKGTPMVMATTTYSNHWYHSSKIDRYQVMDILGIQRTPFPQDIEEPQPTESRWSKALDIIQTGLDVVGFLPGAGELADGINAAIYFARGDHTNAFLSLAAMNPIGGQAATAMKYINKSGLVDDAARAIGKRANRAKGGKPGCNCPGSGKCFTAGTLILTQEGYIPIENIIVGDSVWVLTRVL